MKTLTVNVDKQSFADVLHGEVVKFSAEVTPENVTQLIMLDEEGYEKEDEHGNSIPILYDRILFCTGRGPIIKTALVEVKWCYTEMFVDEDGQVITYEHGGRDWVQEQVVYDLGEILESTPKNN